MIRKWLRNGGRKGARWIAKLLFISMLAVLVVIGAASNPFLGAIAGVFAGLMLRAILPTDRVMSSLERLWTGDAGEDAWETGEDTVDRLKRGWRD